MPAQRPRASFEPLPPDFDLSALVEETPNFQYVDRISCDMIDQQGMDNFDKLVLLHVVIGGKPLVIDGYQSRLDPWTFSSKWLNDNHGEKIEHARDLTKQADMPLHITHYLKNMSRLTDQYFEKQENYRDKNRQRIYLKDIDCPQVWQDKLRDQLPPNLFYLNDNSAEIGGPGAVDEPAPTGGKRKSKGIAGGGDLMSSLPPSMRAENLMCYIGHEGTYTPAHREMCASLGHNIMVEASDYVGDDGKPEKPGSSIWFMTETSDRKTVAEYWLSTLGHDIEVEKHFAQVAAWKKAPFTTYIVEQRPGDFILIPPLAPHQVWNRGTRTMKVAWNRTTVETLEMAMNEALPNARMVCRDEQYKNKAMVYFTLQKYSLLLAKAKDQQQTAPNPRDAARLRGSPKIRQLQKDFKRLFHLFKNILLNEMFAPDTTEKNIQHNPFEGNITCAYCRCNIFNRFLTCPTCELALGTTDAEPYDVCMECYAMGRSCGCISKLRWAEQFKWKELNQKYEHLRKQYIDLEGGPKEDSPMPIGDERAQLGRKTLAQVCQEQLKRRPWVDIKQPEPLEPSDDDNEEIQINEDGTVKKSRKKRSEAWLKNHKACHVCCHRHESWRMAECACGRWYCYGTLFRGHDLMPQSIMEQLNWRCPHCQSTCSAGACRRDPRQKPYEPNGTLLGHDTRAVADARSVESLVDFSVSNLHFLKESVDAPVKNARLLQRQEEANRAKQNDVALNDHYATDEEEDTNQIEYENTNIDPRITGTAPTRSQIGWNAANSVIDPSLRDDDAEDSSMLESTQVSMLNGSRTPNRSPFVGGDYDEYTPASQTGFVAPAAVMYRPPPNDEEEDNFNDVDGHVESAMNSNQRNVGDEEIKLNPAKKRKADDRNSLLGLKAASGATKQYRKEQEKRALEEARKQGRWIMVNAALRNKTRVVKLKLSRQALSQIAANMALSSNAVETNADTEDAEGEEDDTRILVTSDIPPPAKPGQKMNATAPKASKGGKVGKVVRVRVEHDDDFQSSRKGRKSKNASSNKNADPRFEEVDILSESDEEQGTKAVVTTTGGKKRRRVSAWQAKRNDGGDEDIPEELPDDYRDSRRQMIPARPTRPSRPPAGKSVAHLRPAGISKFGLDGADSEDEENNENVQTNGEAFRNNASAASAILEEEENRQAKFDAAGLDSLSPSFDPTSRETTGQQNAVAPLQKRSIFAKRGPGSRKIKIVSSKQSEPTAASNTEELDEEPAVKAVATRAGDVEPASDNSEDSSDSGEVIHARRKGQTSLT